MVQMSLILHFAKERSYRARSLTVQKLASKMANGDACCGAGCDVCGGMREGSMARDYPPYFKYPNLIHLGAEGSLEDIGDQELKQRLKFVQDTQATLLWGFSSST